MKTQQTISILFWIKKNRIQNGNAPLFLRITIAGKRTEIYTNRTINILEWDASNQIATGRSAESKEINIHLSNLRLKVFNCQAKLEIKNEEVTVDKIKAEFKGIAEKIRTIIPIFKQHNNDIESLIGNGYAQGTLVKFNTVLKHLEDFLLFKFSQKDFSLTKLNIEFFCDFEFYLRSQKKIDLNTTAKYLQAFRKIVNSCVNKSWIDKDPFKGFKFKIKLVEREILTEYELELLKEKYFSSLRLELVKDIFLFSCYTGLAYIDVFNLKKSNISIGIDGEKWIFTHRQKTETASKIPLLPPAIDIINKYANHPSNTSNERLLPILSNQKMNAYLKEIADCCGIHKELTFHIARHTFATTVTLSNGVPIESVSKMLGHKKIQTTQHYAKILDKKVSIDMNLLRAKYKNEDPQSINDSFRCKDSGKKMQTVPAFLRKKIYLNPKLTV